MHHKHGEEVTAAEEKPPILGSWRNLYLLVIGNLVFLIVLFFLLTKFYE